MRDLILAVRLSKKLKEQAIAKLKEHGVIAVGGEGNETYFVLHPSTMNPGWWQVSSFRDDGPIGHAENENKDSAISWALEGYPTEHHRVVTEQEFVALTSTPKYFEGSRRVTFTQLDNTLRYETGIGALDVGVARPYLDAAWAAQDIEEGIKHLQAGIKEIRARKSARRT